MKVGLRTRLSLSYILYTLLLIFLISVSANVYLEKHFQDYVKKQQEQKNNEIVALIQQQYRDGEWNRAVIEDIGINALENGMIVKVTNNKGHVIWDATVHNNGMCMQMLSHMANNMKSRYGQFNGEYVENPYIVKHDFQSVGTVQIGYYGPFYFNDSDLDFINSMNKMLSAIGLLALALAVVFGVFMARQLSKPISNVIKGAQLIAKGFFKEKIGNRSSTREIDQLTSTFNHLAETLDKQDALRKQMSADVAHELRTPIATLQSHLEAMIDGIWQPDVQRLKSCHEEVMRIGRMVGDLDKLAKVEAENLILDKESFNLLELARTIVQNFESAYKNKGIELTLTGVDSCLSADRDKISQVIINLLSNALKYTPSGGTVDISVDCFDEKTGIRIQDSGMGIPKEDLPYIFERFYRVDKSRNRLTGGSGIGLSIVKSIVDAHNGKIQVESELGKGTSITVTF